MAERTPDYADCTSRPASKPWHQVDGYCFLWPELSSDVAKRRVETMVDHMIEMTPAERVAFLDKWIPVLADETGAVKAGISAVDQHLVLTALRTWREDNRERVPA